MHVGLCVTTGGISVGSQCVFPFVFRNKTYHSCSYANAKDALPWCSIRVDKDENHISGQGLWGHCSSECPIEPGILKFYELINNFVWCIKISLTVG